jgi:hypothetical protein
MAAVAPEIQRSFSGGEQSPEMEARADLGRYKTSLQTEENFVSLVRGGATRRSGFMDIHAALSVSELYPFAFSDSDAYALEFGVSKLRFYRDYGILESTPGTPYELVTPFTSGEIEFLCTTQSANALYITSGARPLQKLMRNSTLSWTLADAALRLGPFRDANSDQILTLTGDAAGGVDIGGTFNLSASANVFAADMVGGLFRLQIRDQAEFGKWQGPAFGEFSVGSGVYWGDNFYVCDVKKGKTGSEPPVHLFGSAWDGSNVGADEANRWAFKHSGWGVVKITAFTDAQNVAVQAMTYVPEEISTVGTWRWSEGAFSNYRGWPKYCGLHQSRLHLLSNAADPTAGWASRTDDYTNFDATQSGDGDDTAAFSYRLEGNNGKVNLPRWILSSSRLGIGTAGDEHVMIPVNGPTLTPDAFAVVPATAEGSAQVQAVRVEDIVFVSADGERVMEMSDDPNSVRQDAYVANDLTLYADHISGPGIVDMVWQREPYRLLWILRSDGQLAACTFRKDQSVMAWHRHPTVKGTVESICAVPAPLKKRQDLWAITTRTLHAGTVRRVECLMPFFQKTDRDVTDAFFVDGGMIYSGAAATIIAGLDRLNGETVNILADGKVVQPQTVTSGTITLPTAASKVSVGLPLTGLLTTLRCDKDTLGGDLAAKNVRAQSAVVDVIDSAGVEVAAGDKDFELLKPSGGANMDAPAGIYSGTLKVDALEADWSDSNITVRCAQPLPATIRAITPRYQVVR